MSTADRIAASMKAADLTPTEIAAATGISRAKVYRILKGDSDPRMDDLNRIAAALGVDVATLTDRTAA